MDVLGQGATGAVYKARHKVGVFTGIWQLILFAFLFRKLVNFML
jgi:hypothetical protein